MIKLKELNDYIRFAKHLKHKIETAFEGCSVKIMYQIGNPEAEKTKELFCTMHLHIIDSGGNDFCDIQLDDKIMGEENTDVNWKDVFHNANNRVNTFIQTGGKRSGDDITLKYVNQVIQILLQYSYRISDEFDGCDVELQLQFDDLATELFHTLLFNKRPNNLVLNIYDIEGRVFRKINLGSIHYTNIIENGKEAIDTFIKENK